MDLSNSQFDLTASADIPQKLTLLDPRTGEELLDQDGKPVTITLLGRDSTVAKKESKRRSQEMLNRAVRQGATRKISVDETIESAVSLLSKLTVSWSGFSKNGQPYDFSPENAESLYSEFSWIREQVDEFVSDRQNFMAS